MNVVCAGTAILTVFPSFGGVISSAVYDGQAFEVLWTSEYTTAT